MNGSERRKTIRLVVIFSVLVTVVAWTGTLLGGRPTEPGVGFVLWGTAPMLVALLMRAVTRDWSDAGMKPAIRRNARWYLISFLAFPVSMALAVLVSTAASVSSISEFSMGRYLPSALTAFVVFFAFAFFEEFGWRGYLAPKVASLGINSFLGHAVVGVVWASWHLPFLSQLSWVRTSEGSVTFIPRFFLACVAFSIVYGEIRIITGTFWPAVLMHSAGNAFGHSFEAEYLKIAQGKEYLGSVGTGLFTIACFVLLGVAINRWRLHKPPLPGAFGNQRADAVR